MSCLPADVAETRLDVMGLLLFSQFASSPQFGLRAGASSPPPLALRLPPDLLSRGRGLVRFAILAATIGH